MKFISPGKLCGIGNKISKKLLLGIFNLYTISGKYKNKIINMNTIAYENIFRLSIFKSKLMERKKAVNIKLILVRERYIIKIESKTKILNLSSFVFSIKKNIIVAIAIDPN
jgi:hypothetical protein